MAKLLFLDTETGGLNPKTHSLLSLAVVLWEDGRLHDRQQIFVREPELATTPEALAVNKIDLAWLGQNGLAPEAAMQALEAFIAKHFPAGIDGAPPRVTLAGHNVSFDVGFLRRLCDQTGRIFRDRFASRTVDTSGIMAFLMLAGALPSASPTSDFGFSHFRIEIAPDARHTALGDCLATAELFNHLLALVPKPAA